MIEKKVNLQRIKIETLVWINNFIYSFLNILFSINFIFKSFIFIYEKSDISSKKVIKNLN
jgi:hypothetical protein